MDYIEKVKVQQKNWIGRSEGAEVKFTLSTGDDLVVYTTRCDTLFGATYVVISPEHELIDKLKEQITNWDDVAAYRVQASKKSEFERTELAKVKTGVALEGVYAVNPANGEKLPSGFPTTFWSPTARALLWLFLRTTHVTGSLQRSLICL